MKYWEAEFDAFAEQIIFMRLSKHIS